jgi:threonine/homoserine/homoserine lactone efflux protein
MLALIGETLPLAIGIALSPLPVIAAILVLLSPGARARGTMFMVGWLAGILFDVVLFSLFSAFIPASDVAASQPIKATIQLLLGVLLILLALRQWRSRPKAGSEPVMPKWMSALDTMSTSRVFLLGFALAAVNPKNLLLAVSAGLSIGAAQLSLAGQVITTVVFVLIAGSSVSIPVLANLIASTRMQAPLSALRIWLVSNNAVVMGVVVFIIGAVMIGKGMGNY